MTGTSPQASYVKWKLLNLQKLADQNPEKLRTEAEKLKDLLY